VRVLCWWLSARSRRRRRRPGSCSPATTAPTTGSNTTLGPARTNRVDAHFALENHWVDVYDASATITTIRVTRRHLRRKLLPLHDREPQPRAAAPWPTAGMATRGVNCGGSCSLSQDPTSWVWPANGLLLDLGDGNNSFKPSLTDDYEISVWGPARVTTRSRRRPVHAMGGVRGRRPQHHSARVRRPPRRAATSAAATVPMRSMPTTEPLTRSGATAATTRSSRSSGHRARRLRARDAAAELAAADGRRRLGREARRARGQGHDEARARPCSPSSYLTEPP